LVAFYLSFFLLKRSIRRNITPLHLNKNYFFCQFILAINHDTVEIFSLKAISRLFIDAAAQLHETNGMEFNSAISMEMYYQVINA